MPTKPKIPKELILENAFKILVDEGYSNVNIKTIAKKIGCSTQPISWHFSNMNEFRKEFSKYALMRANKIMEPKEGDTTPFNSVGEGYLTIAYDYPNLFKYLYMDGGSNLYVGGLTDLSRDDGNEELAKYLSLKFGFTLEEALNYVLNVLVYTHGLMCLIVSNVVKITKEEARIKMHEACQKFLK